MQASHWQIQPYSSAFKEQLVGVWERSVRATHHFLLPEDIDYYKTLVHGLEFDSFSVYCALTMAGAVAGFIGVAERKIEMLFLDPAFIGQGLGRMLMCFALDKLGADEVDVNEDNIQAVRFYRQFGFATYQRSPLDGAGKPYPILKMRLESTAGIEGKDPNYHLSPGENFKGISED